MQGLQDPCLLPTPSPPSSLPISLVSLLLNSVLATALLAGPGVHQACRCLRTLAPEAASAWESSFPQMCTACSSLLWALLPEHLLSTLFLGILSKMIIPLLPESSLPSIYFNFSIYHRITDCRFYLFVLFFSCLPSRI